MLSGNLSDTSSDALSDLYCHIPSIRSGILSGLSSEILCDRGPAGTTFFLRLLFGSGDLALAVRARRGPLQSWACSGGPAGTTLILCLLFGSGGHYWLSLAAGSPFGLGEKTTALPIVASRLRWRVCWQCPGYAPCAVAGSGLPPLVCWCRPTKGRHETLLDCPTVCKKGRGDCGQPCVGVASPRPGTACPSPCAPKGRLLEPINCTGLPGDTVDQTKHSPAPATRPGGWPGVWPAGVNRTAAHHCCKQERQPGRGACARSPGRWRWPERRETAAWYSVPPGMAAKRADVLPTKSIRQGWDATMIAAKARTANLVAKTAPTRRFRVGLVDSW